MFDSVMRVRRQLGELVAVVDADAVTGSGARALWSEFDKVERLAAGAKTLLARRLAATHRPQDAATRSAAEELARRSGTGTGTAKDQVATSQRLPEQPGVAGGLRRGELSAAQAALISDAAAADPAAEARLVQLAERASVAELRAECLRVKAAADPDPEATHRRIHRDRRLRRWTDAEGGWNLAARGSAEDGAAFSSALDPIIDQIFKEAHQQGRREPHEAYAFDAMIHLADHATGRCSCTADMASESPTDEPGNEPVQYSEQQEPADHLVAGSDADEQPRVVLDAGSAHDGDPGMFRHARGEQPGSGCPVRPTQNPRYLALLRVDAAALQRGHVAGDELCEISGVGPVPVSVARALLGDAVLKLVLTRGVDVLNVTHLGRGPTAAQRAAVLWTNPTCAVEGCTRTRIEFDHTVPWAHTRHTRLDELDGLCAFHHDLRTRLGYALVPGRGKRPLVAPNDLRHPDNQRARSPNGNGQPADSSAGASVRPWPRRKP